MIGVLVLMAIVLILIAVGVYTASGKGTDGVGPFSTGSGWRDLGPLTDAEWEAHEAEVRSLEASWAAKDARESR